MGVSRQEYWSGVPLPSLQDIMRTEEMLGVGVGLGVGVEMGG